MIDKIYSNIIEIKINGLNEYIKLEYKEISLLTLKSNTESNIEVSKT